MRLKNLKSGLVWLLVAAITTVSLEYFLDLTRIASPLLKYYDEDFGSLNRSDIKYFKCKEGLYVGSTNYDGRFRESFPKRKSSKRVLRVGLIGDSFVEGIDVFSANHFGTLMEKQLSDRLQTPVEILNFGRGNCTLHASAYYFENYIKTNYDLDIILYFTEGRDIYEINDYPSTTYSLSDDTLVPNYGWKSSSQYKLHSMIKNKMGLKNYDDLSLFSLTYRSKSSIETRGISRLSFGKFAGEVNGQTYSTEVRENDPVSKLSQALYKKVHSYDKGSVIYVVRSRPLSAPQQLVHMKEQQYPFIRLRDTFEGFNIKNTTTNAYYFEVTDSYGGHWNHEGHKAVSHFLSNYIMNNIQEFNMPNYNGPR